MAQFRRVSIWTGENKTPLEVDTTFVMIWSDKINIKTTHNLLASI